MPGSVTSSRARRIASLSDARVDQFLSTIIDNYVLHRVYDCLCECVFFDIRHLLINYIHFISFDLIYIDSNKIFRNFDLINRLSFFNSFLFDKFAIKFLNFEHLTTYLMFSNNFDDDNCTTR